MGVTAERPEAAFRDTWASLPGVELRILNPDGDSTEKVAVKGRTVMSHILDDPRMDGADQSSRAAFLTGDMGRFDDRSHLQLLDARRNMNRNERR